MKGTAYALFDPIIMQSSYVEQGISGRSPIIGRSGSELWYFFLNIGLPLLCIIIILLILRMRFNLTKNAAETLTEEF
jgi:hypothetical protein